MYYVTMMANSLPETIYYQQQIEAEFLPFHDLNIDRNNNVKQ